MATRAPKGAARPNGGSAGRGRQAGGSARAGTASGGRDMSSRGGSRSGGARKGAGRTGTNRTRAGRGGTGARRGGTPYYRRRAPTPPRRTLVGSMRASNNPFLILIGWVLSGIGAVWMELATGVGHVTRLFGDSARDLDPAHRRDGAGLAVLAARIGSGGSCCVGDRPRGRARRRAPFR